MRDRRIAGLEDSLQETRDELGQYASNPTNIIAERRASYKALSQRHRCRRVLSPPDYEMGI